MNDNVIENVNVLMKHFDIKYHIANRFYSSLYKNLYIKKRIYRISNYNQIGGKREKINDTIVDISSNNKSISIQTKITRFKVINDETGEEFAELYLLSPLTDKIYKSCITVRIDKNSTIAHIADVNICFNCTNGSRNPDKAGETFMNIIINYLKINKNELGIKTLELEDMTSKIISSIDPPNTFELSLSRQLEGKKPYYMKFNFFPERLSAYAKIHNNRKKMKKLLTEDHDIIGVLTRHRDKIQMSFKECLNLINLFNELIEYIDNPNIDLMLETITYIRYNYSSIFIRIYLDLFKLFKLQAPIDDENLYYLDL